MYTQNDQKKELYEDTYTNEQHFSFGKNWEHFLKSLHKERIKEAEKSLVTFLNGKENIVDKTFVDIGCGSGLFSLAAYNLGAKKVVSVDIDDFSISCVALLRKHQNNPKKWKIRKGSVLNIAFLNNLDTFDIVYSWGVLHHTGDMYKAIKNSSTLLNPGGKMYIAIYNNNQKILEGTSNFWRTMKKTYNNSPWIVKVIAQVFYATYYVLGLTLHGKNPLRYIKNYKSLRGMNFFTDIKDWLGGYPYEFASSETIVQYCKKIGLKCVKKNPARSIGCNEFIFVDIRNEIE